MATRSVGPGIPRKPGVACYPDASRKALIDKRGPAGLGHDDALFLEAMEELDEQERVAASLLGRALPADLNVLT